MLCALRSAPFLALAMFVVGDAESKAIVIDDFSSGQIVVDTTAPFEQTGLDPDHVVGGRRHIRIGQYDHGSRLEIADEQLHLSSTGWGYFTLTYGAEVPLGGLDLTEEGHDRLQIRFGEIGAGFHPLRLYVNLPNLGSSYGVGMYVRDAWDDLIVEIPYSSFPVPFTSVDRIILDAYRNPAGTGFAIDSIITAGPPTPGDFDRNGVVDVDDLSVWKETAGLGELDNHNILTQVVASADADEDGRVDGADFLAWQRSLGASRASAATVPEPATLTLGLMAALALTSRKRQGGMDRISWRELAVPRRGR